MRRKQNQWCFGEQDPAEDFDGSCGSGLPGGMAQILEQG